MRIAVFGASGFVGATLVDQLWDTTACEVRPVIHSSGNAARLARFGRTLVGADVLQPRTLDRVLEGCTHVVNCSRGPAQVMTAALENMLQASRRSGIRRFVHLSSVAVYNEVQAENPLVESERPHPVPNTYGWIKHRQDELVARAQAAGLSCAVLCPPNISGPYSAFFLEIVNALRRREFALVDGGRLPCELIDVANLVHAIRLALEAHDPGEGRIFVTDGRHTSWSDVAVALAPLAGHPLPLPSITAADAQALTAKPAATPASVFRAARHLMSSDVRAALRKDPWFASAEVSVKGRLKSMPVLNEALRRRFKEPPPGKRARPSPQFSERLVSQQLRKVRYSQDRAQQRIGFHPAVSPESSMAAFTSWYRQLFGGEREWSLTGHLYE